MLKRTPAENDLSRLYYELALIGAPAMGSKKSWPYHPKSLEELLTLACSMVRYDPRLLGILIIYFKDFWEKIHLVKLRKALAIGETPQVVGVIGEFVKKESRNPEVTYFFEYLTRGMKPVPLQLFFIGTYPFGSRHLETIRQRGLKEYKKWGFLSTEKPVVDLKTKRQLGSLSQSSRLSILISILNKEGKITLKKYLDAIDHSVTRQQALADFVSVKGLKVYGRGRAALWKLTR